jgi:hypothetical protein
MILRNESTSALLGFAHDAMFLFFFPTEEAVEAQWASPESLFAARLLLFVSLPLASSTKGEERKAKSLSSICDRQGLQSRLQ